ncbi:malate dehydrogenase (oxaloacetate-decarboxylating)(NADP+) (plasmid) [Azospirillum sp. B510]|uniref:NADP-dependent malic enzyme n=1 Tax=Azospirillum sp. (strain B510) TaxID=137722 RepID=UPI0001C4BB5E|nr:NADP-dependent malic enzyme [Azospirillum sp. B510]BAI74383.1 malate dehydrogenase (oxaloacetate-decarboxylating)(NADP+) [Azospirillum sp. B510]
MSGDLKERALEYHRLGKPGKLAIVPTKPMMTQRDLALAYSPGVAFACTDIVADPANAAEVTARGNLVAVISNGTAVLGLGDIGPLASKPVMEGKAVLFKKFADIDVFDIEVDEKDVDALVDTIARLEPTFGAINLEDIGAPACFEVERRLKERMKIPVFHDDQHGTAIVVAAAVYNALQVVGKRFEDVRVVSTGGGAAGIACLDLLVGMGVKRSNIILADREGVVYQGRNAGMNPYKDRYATAGSVRGLDEAMAGADIFLGLSGPGVLTGAMVRTMAARPLILALANPDPEITPEEARAARPDAIIATGRSDYPNQVNNVLCFPFIFRGALDVGATTINEAMKIACVKAIADMARIEASDVVAAAYTGEQLRFGPDYILPKPFDPRLIVDVASAVAQAAMESGVATRPIADLRAYRERLGQYVFRSGLVMKPVFHKAAQAPKRVVYAEGEDERVLRAAQVAVDEGIARPILLGRDEVVARRIEQLGLRLASGRDVTVVDPVRDPRCHEYADVYRQVMGRRGVSPNFAATMVRADATVFASLMVRRGAADAMVCGTAGRYAEHHRHIRDLLGRRGDAPVSAAMTLLILGKGTYFLTDTHVNPDPSAEEIAEIAVLAAEKVRHFGIEPKVALLSHSNFGSSDSPSALKMRAACELLRRRAPELGADGEMQAGAALCEAVRDAALPNGRLRGQANLLVMPTLDAANIALEMLKVLSDGLSVGPILLGVSAPAHIVTPEITTRGIVNVTALAVVDAQIDTTPVPLRQAAE